MANMAGSRRTERLYPGKRRIRSNAQGDPLLGVARQGDQRPCNQADCDRANQIADDNARRSLFTGEGPQRERRQYRHQLANRRPKRMRMHARHQPFALATHRLAQRCHPDRHRKTRQADCQVRGLPPLEAERRGLNIRIGDLPAVHDPAAEEDADAGADVDAARIDREHGGSHGRRKVVRQHRKRRRGGAGLADTDPDSVGGERREAARRARKCGHQAPETEPDGDQVLARPKCPPVLPSGMPKIA